MKIKPVTMRDVLLNKKYNMDGHYFYVEDINDLIDYWHENTTFMPDGPRIEEGLYEFIGRKIVMYAYQPDTKPNGNTDENV